MSYSLSRMTFSYIVVLVLRKLNMKCNDRNGRANKKRNLVRNVSFVQKYQSYVLYAEEVEYAEFETFHACKLYLSSEPEWLLSTA